MKKHSKNSEEEETITLTKTAIWQMLTAVFAILFVISLFTSGFGINGTSTNNAQGKTPTAAPAAPTQPTAAKTYDVNKLDLSKSPYIGDKNAPLTMAFWSDFQCPFCQRFELQTFPTLVTKYVNTGKLKVVFMDFPFLGKDSATASEYSQSIWNLYPDQYFAWRTAMYVAQDAEGDQGFGDAPSIDALIQANFTKMDDAKIKADITTNKATYDAQIQKEQQIGQQNGIKGTPGFIVGTQQIVGAQPLAKFTAAIDAELAK